MSLYKFKERGASFGLGYQENEMVDLPAEGITATILVPEVDEKGMNTGKMVIDDKSYTAQFLQENGIIIPANPSEIKAFNKVKAAHAIAVKKGEKMADSFYFIANVANINAAEELKETKEEK